MIINGVDISSEEASLGFYYSDDKSSIVYEVIKNTGEVWLKESPEIIYLVDTWMYDHTDYRGARIYGCDGTLINLNNIDFELTKITDTKYKISKDGMTLEEDKPTYTQLERYLKQLQTDYDKLVQQIRQTDIHKIICDRCQNNVTVLTDESRVTEYTNNEIDLLTLKEIISRLKSGKTNEF